MNSRLFVSALILTLVLNPLKGQNTVKYSYDANGNRNGRTLKITQLKSAVIDFPADTSKLENRSPGDLNNSIHVFPNPVKSTMHISITGYDNARKRSVFVYGISGNTYLRKEKIENFTEVDLSALDDGMYILRIIIDDEVIDYKIIKSR